MFSLVTKKLPGVRKYVDPQNYASPESALKDFACEIPSHQLRLDEVIGGGERIFSCNILSMLRSGVCFTCCKSRVELLVHVNV